MKNGHLQSGGGNKGAWWRERSQSERRLIIASFVSAVLLLLFLLGYLIVSDVPAVCTSAACVRASVQLLGFMDPSADPCRDFFQFACGNFPADRLSVDKLAAEDVQAQVRAMLLEPAGLDPPSFDLAKAFYRACMNESAIEAVSPLHFRGVLKRVGGWPTLSPHNWREDLFDWKEAAHGLRHAGINSDFFFVLTLEADKTDPNRYILSIKDPAYSPSQISNSIKTLYLDYMVDVAVLMGANKNRARDDQNGVMHFLLSLAKISEEAKSANGTKPYNPLSLSELQYALPDVPWHDYINKLLAPAAQITYDDVVNVPEPLYLKKLLELLKKTSKRVIANFISWHILQRTINYLPPKVLDRAYEYLGKVKGKMTSQPRWSMCVDAVEYRMSPVISAAYIERYFAEENRKRAIEMTQNLKRQLRVNLLNADWLDEETREKAVERLVTSVEDIASYRSLSAAAERYEKVEILEDQALASAQNLEIAATNHHFSKLRQPVKDDFFEQPGAVTGLKIVYSPKEHSLKIPLGLFQGILFQTNRPDYMNYGALGTQIAHEMYHIIMEAEYRNSDGNLRSWWSSQSLLNYEERLNCVSNQYELDTGGAREEDLADVAGAKAAHAAYVVRVLSSGVEGQLPGLAFSPKQLFWIAAAVRHCARSSNETLMQFMANSGPSPASVRVNGALRNLDEFAGDFACARGAEMHPDAKCRL